MLPVSHLTTTLLKVCLQVQVLSPKNKEKILKAAKEKALFLYKGSSIRLTANFSLEAMEAIRQWDDTFKVLKGKTKQKTLLTKNSGPGRTILRKRN